MAAELFAGCQDKAPLAEDEYIQDGLKHCKACGNPRQCRIPLEGRVFIMRVPCQCEQEERDRQEIAQEAARKARKRERLLRGITDTRYRTMTFQASTAPLNWARKYVDGFEKYKAENIGLMLIGEPGTGKTFAAACIANALVEKEYSVYMARITDITRRLAQTYDEDLPRFIDKLQGVSLLIVDDFGVQRASDAVRELVDQLIDIRYSARKPLIITSNLTLDNLKDRQDLFFRSYDRLKELCHPIEMKGDSYRRKAGNANAKRLREELGC